MKDACESRRVQDLAKRHADAMGIGKSCGA